MDCSYIALVPKVLYNTAQHSPIHAQQQCQACRAKVLEHLMLSVLLRDNSTARRSRGSNRQPCGYYYYIYYTSRATATSLNSRLMSCLTRYLAFESEQSLSTRRCKCKRCLGFLQPKQQLPVKLHKHI